MQRMIRDKQQIKDDDALGNRDEVAGGKGGKRPQRACVEQS